MKYPAKQFENLVVILKQLNEYFEIKQMNYSNLHYIAYQQSQSSEGQKHNIIYVKNSILRKAHAINDLNEWQPIVNKIDSFELYPEGCNDQHIETAVKNALKLI